MNLLMIYASVPHTTATYLERSLRKEAGVRTIGPTISDGTLRAWNLEMLAGQVRAHDLSYRDGSLGEMLRELGDFRPDWLLFVESGLWFEMAGVDASPWPRACYLIDTHLMALEHLKTASRFDVVFLAQKEYVEPFRKQLSRPVFWLPLAADPEIHRPVPSEERFDLGICGSEGGLHNRRTRRLARLSLHFSVGKKRVFLEEMSRFLSECRLLFNSSVNSDLNMRVFESLAIGKCLLTDPVPGLLDLFREDKDLVLYDDPDLIEKARYLLDSPRERAEIAENGRRRVLAAHTYDHRARALLRILEGSLRVPKKGEDHVAHTYV